ncbi:hypothetical protein RCO28_21785 [Streptomyces sp. LHD-70]|uniref:hypothetical protein n=1 Tax=Streptomyces sp. LHD-70 TaxID=3072140 RepID=UPI00280D22C8|nr:hypothetical protein [Streptomyces sp. LHD-70]MDQ8705104.1 hypothetical protein [Streptomyces sp. LHD-70]
MGGGFLYSTELVERLVDRARRNGSSKRSSAGPSKEPLAGATRSSLHFTSGVAMADVAFVVTTVAVFALVALVAKGVAKL